jgi:predicted metal-dependent HD superfamily phosphohydrolase
LQLYERLITRYSEPHRRYHTVRHLDECFEKLGEIRALAEHPAEVDVALWFHDAIYDPSRDDNEARSAEWARSSVAAAGVPAVVAGKIGDLVLATRHVALPRSIDAKVVVDVDLSILGAGRARFDEYEAQIREEYGFVPEPDYRRSRAAILERFLSRPTIFSTKAFIERYEQQARANLERALARR